MPPRRQAAILRPWRDGHGWRVSDLCTELLSGAGAYRSGSQIARVITEHWAADQLYCPSCGNDRITAFPANSPVADFYCGSCGLQYELKSKKAAFGRTITNGAYQKKVERLLSDTSPNLLLLQYDLEKSKVVNLLAIPKRFFTQSIISARKPLSARARRAGWVGSTIHLHLIPTIGRISLISNGTPVDRDTILDKWKQTAFIDKAPVSARGWLIDVLACNEMIEREEFSLEDVYAFEDHLRRLYPSNNNVRPKIRQQLQVLRDNGIVAFLGAGIYRKLL